MLYICYIYICYIYMLYIYICYIYMYLIVSIESFLSCFNPYFSRWTPNPIAATIPMLSFQIPNFHVTIIWIAGSNLGLKIYLSTAINWSDPISLTLDTLCPAAGEGINIILLVSHIRHIPLKPIKSPFPDGTTMITLIKSH